MERKDGFIDLCALLDLPRGTQTYEYEIEIVERLSKNKSVQVLKFEPGLNLLFSFWYDGAKYFFNYDSLANPFNELWVGNIYDDLQLPHVDYDIACIGSIKGNLSRDYIIKDAKYLSGRDILPVHIDYELNENMIEDYGYEEAFLRECARYNSLEGIWHGLEERYRGRPEVVEKIMDRIVNLFIVDILTGQRDRHFDNWHIIEFENGSVELMPYFDNGRAFSTHPVLCRMGLSVSNLNQGAPSVLLEKNVKAFMKETSEVFTSRMLESLWVLLPQNVEKIIERIEGKIGCPLSEKDKEIYKNNIAEHLKYLMDALGIDSVSMTKRIAFKKENS